MYEALKEQFGSVFGRRPTMLFSAPGRTELIGNHTDHQGGVVLGASINLETAAAVRPTDENVIRILSEGYPECRVGLDSLDVQEEELPWGVAAGFAKRGFQPMGFEACVCSSVLSGSGLSSSAAFEVLIGTILNHLTGAGFSALEIAKIGQEAENRYYGKPSGLLDQASAASGGIVFLDFAPGKEVFSETIPVNFEDYGYAIVVIDSGADHADLTAPGKSDGLPDSSANGFCGKWTKRSSIDSFLPCGKPPGTAPFCGPCTSMTRTNAFCWPVRP